MLMSACVFFFSFVFFHLEKHSFFDTFIFELTWLFSNFPLSTFCEREIDELFKSFVEISKISN